MVFQRFVDCPWSGAHIELREEGRAYMYPVCASTFSPPRWGGIRCSRAPSRRSGSCQRRVEATFA